jgi:hypothetical protein
MARGFEPLGRYATRDPSQAPQPSANFVATRIARSLLKPPACHALLRAGDMLRRDRRGLVHQLRLQPFAARRSEALLLPRTKKSDDSPDCCPKKGQRHDGKNIPPRGVGLTVLVVHVGGVPVAHADARSRVAATSHRSNLAALELIAIHWSPAGRPNATPVPSAHPESRNQLDPKLSSIYQDTEKAYRSK